VRSVILRSRPGRPRWQLTTRPTTAAMLGVVSLVAAGAQLTLLSTPTPWYQWAVAGFWAVVGLAFLASAVGTRVRARRRAAAAASRVPVDSVPFVPVPIRPARPRRRDGGVRDGEGDDEAGEVHTGEPTDDLGDAVRTASNPVVTASPVVAATGEGRPVPEEPSEPAVPTTRTRNRHAVRAVLSVETASREIPLPVAVEEAPAPSTGSHRGGRSRRGPARKATGIRDGRVRPAAPESARPAASSDGDPATDEVRRPAVPDARRSATGEARRPVADSARRAAADGAVRPGGAEPRRPAPAEPRRPEGRPAAAPRDPVASGPAAPSGAVPVQRGVSLAPRPERDRRPVVEQTPAGESGRPVSRMTFGVAPERARENRSSDALKIDALSSESRPGEHRDARNDTGRRTRGPAPIDTGRHVLSGPRDVPAPRESGSGSPRRARHAAPAARAETR
jgi:hypothetical protein